MMIMEPDTPAMVMATMGAIFNTRNKSDANTTHKVALTLSSNSNDQN